MFTTQLKRDDFGYADAAYAASNCSCGESFSVDTYTGMPGMPEVCTQKQKNGWLLRQYEPGFVVPTPTAAAWNPDGVRTCAWKAAVSPPPALMDYVVGELARLAAAASNTTTTTTTPCGGGHSRRRLELSRRQTGNRFTNGEKFFGGSMAEEK